MITQLKELFDNPIYRILYSRAYVRKVLRTGGILPFIFLALLLGLYHIFSQSFSTVISLGLLIFICLGGVYFFICVIYALGTDDPVSKSLPQHVADQLVITGLTPFTWLKGHLLFCIINWLFLTVFFLPYMYLAWLLGGIPFILPLATALAALFCMISARLITLLLTRSPVIGLASMIWFIAVVIGNVIVLVKSLPVRRISNYPMLRLLSLFSPLGMFLKELHLYSNDLFIKMFSNYILSLSSLTALISSFIMLHFLFWIFAAINIISGLPRAHFDIPDKLDLDKKSVLSGFFNVSQPNHRTLSPKGLFLLFQQNTFSKHYPKFEFLGLTMTTFITGIMFLMLTWQSIVSNIDLSVVVLIISAILIFIFSISACFSLTTVTKANNPINLLFPIYFNWILRMLMILSFIFTAYNFSKDNSHSLIMLLPILIFLSLIFSVFSSTKAKTFLDAVGIYLLCFILFAGFNFFIMIALQIAISGLQALTKFNQYSKVFTSNMVELIESSPGITSNIIVIRLGFILTFIGSAVYCLVKSYYQIKKQKNE